MLGGSIDIGADLDTSHDAYFVSAHAAHLSQFLLQRRCAACLNAQRAGSGACQRVDLAHVPGSQWLGAQVQQRCTRCDRVTLLRKVRWEHCTWMLLLLGHAASSNAHAVLVHVPAQLTDELRVLMQLPA